MRQPYAVSMRSHTVPIALVPADPSIRQAVAAALREGYGIPADADGIRAFSEETVGSTVFLAETDRGPVVIKRYVHADRRALEMSSTVSEALRERGAPLAPVFRTRSEGHVHPDGSAAVVVSGFVDGAHFDARPVEFAAAGEALGRFHAAGAAYLRERPEAWTAIADAIPEDKPYGESVGLYADGLREELLAGHVCAIPEVCEAFRAGVGTVDAAVALVAASGLWAPERTRGILHNDCHANNMLFAPDGALRAALDVDQMGIGPFAADLGNTIASLSSNVATRGREQEVEPGARAFLRAYHRAFPLPTEEYLRVLAGTQAWDVRRVLRRLREHRDGREVPPVLLRKVVERFLPRLSRTPALFAFLTEGWVRETLAP